MASVDLPSIKSFIKHHELSEKASYVLLMLGLLEDANGILVLYGRYGRFKTPAEAIVAIQQKLIQRIPSLDKIPKNCGTGDLGTGKSLKIGYFLIVLLDFGENPYIVAKL